MSTKQDMLDKINEIWGLYILEIMMCVNELEMISISDWPDFVLKENVDQLKKSIYDSRSKLKSSRVLLDSLLEAYEVYSEVFPKEKPAIQPQPSALSNKPMYSRKRFASTQAPLEGADLED
jgi:hypothetical protein